MPKAKDVNAQLQEWIQKGVKPDEQVRQVNAWMQTAKPFIIHWAQDIGEIRNLNEKSDALKDFFKNGVAQLTPDDRMTFRDELCAAANIKTTQWTERLKNLNGHKKKNEAEENDEPIFTTGGWLFEHFVGLEYDPEEDKTFFAVRFPDGRVEDHLERVRIGDRKFIPIPSNNIIRKRVILLPSQMSELKDEKDLLFAIKVHNAKYFDFGADATFEQLCMIYPFFTYLARQFRTVPYLRALGDYGTGKSRLLKTIGPICFQPIMTNAGSSASSLFRILDLFTNSTLVLDEADFNNSDEASMIAKILNGGNENGVPILRSEKNELGNFDAAAFDVFGPKILGMRKDFQDQATGSRCLTKEMLSIMPHPRIPLDLPPVEVYEKECLAIRNALFTYMMHNIQKACQVDLNAIDRAIDNRTAQVTVSLLTVMKSEEGRDLVREYLKNVTEERKGDRYATFTARVLEGIMLAWAWGPVSDRPEDADRIYLKDISEATNQIVDEQNRQMGELEEEEEKEKDGKKGGFRAKSRKIGNTMKTYLNLKTIRATDGTPAYKGTNYVNMEMETERVKGLCERWAVEWRERGSVKRPQVISFLKTPPAHTQPAGRVERDDPEGPGVKNGEDKLALSATEKKFLCGEKPRKVLHQCSPRHFQHNCSDKYVKKCRFVADRHRKVRQSEQSFC